MATRTRKLGKSAPAKPDVYKDCLVSYVDILGFSELVGSGKATDVLQSLRDFHQEAMPGQIDINLARDTPEISHPRAYSISDALVRVRQLDAEYHDGCLIHEVEDLIFAQIELLRKGILVRGGISVGEMHHEELESGSLIFGPALIRAYKIENEEAIFPRIVVDDQVLLRHSTDLRLRSQNSLPDEERAQLDRYLATSDDGTRFIDYLAGAEALADDVLEYYPFIQEHATFVRQALIRNWAPKIARKYQWLKRYHNRHADRLARSIMASSKSQALFFEIFDESPSDFLREIVVD